MALLVYPLIPRALSRATHARLARATPIVVEPLGTTARLVPSLGHPDSRREHATLQCAATTGTVLPQLVWSMAATLPTQPASSPLAHRLALLTSATLDTVTPRLVFARLAAATPTASPANCIAAKKTTQVALQERALIRLVPSRLLLQQMVNPPQSIQLFSPNALLTTVFPHLYTAKMRRV